MQKIHSVSVRALAEFAFEKGDLIPAARAASRMRDGVRGHQALQEMLPVSWRPEVPVSRDIPINGRVLRVHGRADALYIDRDIVRVQEIKTTVKDPTAILKYDYPAHWAQGEIYAALFCLNEGVGQAEVRLTYARLDGKKQEYTEEYNAWELEERLMAYAGPYLDWITAVDDWKDRSKPTLDSLPFPFDSYRAGQREMARAVYLAMKNHSNALIEAPTGIGKTAASLFGALKALGKGFVTAIFYLTARTTGRRAAEDALDLMRGKGLAIRSVTITAKEKCCLLEKADCMGCPYAAGYYDRRREALKEAMRVERLDADAIRELALNYELCPFELSLDISETADVIICDYNYAFDPKVRLKRWFDSKSRAGLLVDEAHNLADRARDMLSAELSGAKLAELRRLAARFEGKESPMARLMGELLTAFDGREAERESLSELPEGIVQAVKRFTEIAEELEAAEPEIVDFVYEAQWFVRVAKQFDAASYRALIVPEDRYMTIRLWCFDPSKHLKKALSRVGGAVLFSATLAPMEYYAAILGADGEADAGLRLESPFPRENLLALRMPVAVGMKDRERTLTAVSQIIHAMAEAHPGNYLACFPSYAYMTQAFRRYRMLWPYDDVICQESQMPERARQAFIECFQPAPKRSMVAFIVLGGVFAEGVDLPDDRLSGAAIVSTGIPQLSFERELLREQLDDADDGGYDAAYTYPGLRRVLQAAGRVIRTETDRGVVLLMDMRYKQEKYRALMPPHWDVMDVKKMSELNERLKRFWNDGAEE
ncbi:MAG: hypothetical protein IJ769_06670 [Clostridia bacterium]|nr:hypothetical protein [Clostridia bacterium]